MTEPITVDEIIKLKDRPEDPQIQTAFGENGLKIIAVEDDEGYTAYVLFWAPDPKTIELYICESPLQELKTVFIKTIKGFGAVGMASGHVIDDELRTNIAKSALIPFAFIFRIPELAEKLNEMAQDLQEAKMEVAALDKTRHDDGSKGVRS